MSEDGFLAAAIQTNQRNPVNRREMGRNTSRNIELVDLAVAGYAPFLPLRLLVFPEFAHAAPVYANLKELRERLGIEIPNRHTDRAVEKAKELDVYIQMGSMLEIDKKYKNALFNTACLVGPEGIIYKYRKVYPWIPWEVHTSPHDIPDYEEELFPVARTEVGVLGTAICYDWLFPECLRELAAQGAEILLRVSAYMDPYGATNPNDWWTIVNRCRALENISYVVAANQGASLRNYPPFSWPGGSMIVDYDGRIVAQATPGDGEKITVGPINLGMLRREREARLAHLMPLHVRSEAHRGLAKSCFPAGSFKGEGDRTYRDNAEQIERVREERAKEGSC